MHEVHFLPVDIQVNASPDTDLLTLSRQAGIAIEQTCNGKGTCGKCVVRVEGAVTDPSPSEVKLLGDSALQRGYRLACCTFPRGTVRVTVAEARGVQVLATSVNVESLRGQSGMRKQYLQLPVPSLSDQRDDLTRVLEGLGIGVTPDLSQPALAGLHDALRQEQFACTALLWNQRLLGVEPGDTTARLYGVGFDIGTTTVVGYLMDLNSAEQVGVATMLNPQTQFGGDVISRIEFSSASRSQARMLQESIIHALDDLIETLCVHARISAQDVCLISVAGNTTMLHLALGLPAMSIAQAPYIPVVTHGLDLSATAAGLVNVSCSARLITVPHIASYVGADITADLLTCGMLDRTSSTLMIDIGTNGEMVLGCGGRLVAASTAAGPCFEGGSIRHGMRATTGAIHAVRLDASGIHLDVIGDGQPAGLCGTGLVDLVSEMVRTQLVDESGRLQLAEDSGCDLEALTGRVRETEQGNEFVLVYAQDSATGNDIVLTQRDVRQVQNAKAAIMAGIEIMCAKLSIRPSDIDAVLLAGAFGNYISRSAAIRIGLLPAVPEERVESIGNAAGVGAVMYLLSSSVREAADTVAQRVDYIELSGEPDFTEAYADAMFFE